MFKVGRSLQFLGMIAQGRRTLHTFCLSVFAAVLLAGPAGSQTTDPFQFEKHAFKPDGTPWTGPVNTGDIIHYVLSYQPNLSVPGPVTINDTLSPGQSYIGPTNASDSGWTWSANPYSSGNAETYVHGSFSPNVTGAVTVQTTPASSGQALTGDGTLPIPVLSEDKVFGVFHHVPIGAVSAINCWNLHTLIGCAGYPKSTIEASVTAYSIMGTAVTTLAVVRNTSGGQKIYFPGLRGATTNNGAGNPGIPTIACFNATTNAACADQLLIAGSTATAKMSAIGGLTEDPTTGRVFVAVDDKVFCRTLDSTATWVNCPEPTWTPTGTIAVTPAPTNTYNVDNVFVHVEQSAAPQHLYIHHGSGVLQCLMISDGTLCPNWPTTGIDVGLGGASLSSVPDAAGTGEQGVCLWGLKHQPRGCLDVSGLSLPPITGPALGNVNNPSISSFRLPLQPKVFFPLWGATNPVCVTYSGTTANLCLGFVGNGPSTTDYGFSLDPLDPQNCMLALGHQNIMYRFDSTTGALGCGRPSATTPAIESIFCDNQIPGTFDWTQISVDTPNADGTLTITGGATSPITLHLSAGTTSYPMPAGVGSGSVPLTFTFQPSAGANNPAAVELKIGYASDKKPQICYSTVVDQCLPVYNAATFSSDIGVMQSASVQLGNPSGPDCSAARLKVCKVAGPGVALGTPFDFTVGAATFSIPAGAAPGGTCIVTPPVPVGTSTAVVETLVPGVTVSDITVVPADRVAGGPNLAAGSVNVTAADGVTEVTFTNKSTGFLEICKTGVKEGTFSFMINPGGPSLIVVAAGTCSPAIEVGAGKFVITEAPSDGTSMTRCTTFPAGRQGLCDLEARSSTVTVPPGDVSTQTIAFIENGVE